MRDPLELAWSADGRRLYVLTAGGLRVLDGNARPAASDRALPPPSEQPHLDVAARPGGGVAVARRTPSGSEVFVGGRRLLAGPGLLSGLAWSPDGRWLAVTWPEADQLVFVRVAGERRIVAVSNVGEQFESERFPRLAGWCCLP